MADFDERFAPLADITAMPASERLRAQLLARLQAENYNRQGGKSLSDLDPFETAAARLRGPYRNVQPGTSNLPAIADTVLGGLEHAVTVPGAMMTPNPYPEGSEQWQFFEDQRYKGGMEWAPGMALNTIGSGGLARPIAVAPGEMVLGSGARRIKRSTEIPSIRGKPVDEAIAIARKEPHLIRAGEQSEGFYVGGPRDLTSKRALNKRRAAFDEYVAADPRGGDWYDRYRAGVNEVTGGDPVQNRWMTAQEGQWSAGVDPGSELAFALKENNAALAGMPTKAGRPASHKAFLDAIAAQNPSLLARGKKTGEYQRLITPDQPLPPGATGVNDFRHARNWGYTEASGAPQKGSVTGAAHTFLDMETALAVDRANKMNLGGRSNWTGEQLQAAPWVRQKALDIQARGGKNKDGSFKLSYEDAFARANRTIVDFFDKHTAFGTHEIIPGNEVVGHLPGAATASQAERIAYSADPGSGWATAPGGRDAIYAGMGIPGTGVNMRVRPTLEMQGFYKPPEGPLETNPGFAARPLVAFTTGKGGTKTVAPADQTLLNAGEAYRAWADAQNAGAWHKPWLGGRATDSNSLFVTGEGARSVADMQSLQTLGRKYGLGDVSDTGMGTTVTSFWPPPTPDVGKAIAKEVKKGGFADFGDALRAKVDSNLLDLVEQWRVGEGSGKATAEMLKYTTATPEIRAAFNNNPYLAERAAAQLERDAKWRSRWGVSRQDITNARKIVAEGTGGIDRLEAALKKGAISLPAFAAIVGSGMASREE